MQSTGTNRQIPPSCHLVELSSWPVHDGELVFILVVSECTCQNVYVEIHYDRVRSQFHLAHKSAEVSIVAWGLDFCTQPYTGANGEREEQLNTTWNFVIIGANIWEPRAWSIALTIYMMMASNAAMMTVPSTSHCHNATHCAHFAACVERFPVTTPRKLDRCYTTQKHCGRQQLFPHTLSAW